VSTETRPWVDPRQVRVPVADWATTLCRYAVRKGWLELWHDCAQQATFELAGDFYCYEHFLLLKEAER
jgi:hypothetical protein